MIFYCSQRVKEKTNAISFVTKEIAVMAERDIPNLIQESTKSQVSRILTGDYNLKLARQDYFISNQDQVGLNTNFHLGQNFDLMLHCVFHLPIFFCIFQQRHIYICDLQPRIWVILRGVWCLTSLQHYISNIVMVSFIGWGNWSTRRKPAIDGG